jgi:F-type H+-transporting ATPase subunit epsilon
LSKSLRLTVTTPNALLVDEEGVMSLRAEDETGGFGILPGHTDFLTVLPASVVRWRNAAGSEAYCALRGGVLTVSRGERVSIACRQGVLGGDLQKLEAEVHRARAERLDEAARARVEQMRLHANAVRQLIRCLHPSCASEAVLFSEEKGAP